MKPLTVCFIGQSGHWKYAFNGINSDPSLHIAGVAPGSSYEDISTMVEHLKKFDYKPPYFQDYKQMLEETKPDIAVIDNPFSDHASAAIAALEHDCHLFIEKPIATTWTDLNQLKRAYEKSTVHLAAMHGLRYAPAFYTAWRAVQEGAIGDTRLIHTQKSYQLKRRASFYRKRDSYGGTIPW